MAKNETISFTFKYLLSIKVTSTWYFYDVRSPFGNFLFAVVVIQVGGRRAKCFDTFSDFQSGKKYKVIELNKILENTCTEEDEHV